MKCIENTVWVRASDNKVVHGSQIAFACQEITLGDDTYKWEDLQLRNGRTRVSLDETDCMLTTELCALRSGWMVERFLAPLFELAMLSLRSMRLFSGVPFTAILVTRSEDKSTVGTVCHKCCDQFDLVRFIDAHDLEDFAFARYRVISDVADVNWTNYCPIIYLDSDMICDNELLQMCVQARRSSKLMVATEGRMLNNKGDWYGANLLKADGSVRIDPDDLGFSTGILVAPDSESLGEFGSRICSTRASLAVGAPSLLKSRVFDQPVANYVARKLGTVDSHTLTRMVRLVGHGNEAPVGDSRGLAHFAGGVGNHGPKLPRMQAYLAKLEALNQGIPGMTDRL